ncbi:MAG TPA: hypothetical protein VFM53_12880 [Anaeromyxobacteraceae bacterium]|nr:hypothetical protein [Anaeromyxobacteraceae bacterium]
MESESTRGRLVAVAILGALAASGCAGTDEAQLLAAAADVAAADEASARVVTGRGDPAADVPAVQAAVSAGGRVKLAGTFDFGPMGSVVITRDVAISGRDGATVKGGFRSFYGPLPGGAVPSAPGPSISIENLTFDGASWSPIHLAYARSVTIRHNRIRNVRPYQPSGFPLGLQAGIHVTTYYQSGNKALVFPGALTGEIEIRDNELDMSGPAPLGTLCQGINVVRVWGASVSVRGNTIVECSRSSIEAIDNHLDEKGRGGVLIAENRIRTATSGVAWPTPQTPDGIVAGWFLDATGATDPARNPGYHVVGNRIEARGGTATGIYSSSSGARIERNRVRIGGPGAYGIAASAPETRLSGNRVVGEGLYAFAVFAYPSLASLVPTGVVSTCDRAPGFTARSSSGAAFLLGGNHNTVIGFDGTVFDDGSDNRVLAVRHEDGGVEQGGDCGPGGDGRGDDDQDLEAGGR